MSIWLQRERVAVCDQLRSRWEIAHGRRKGPAGSQTRHTTDRCHAIHHRRGGTFSRLGHCGPSLVEATASHLSPNSTGQGLFFSLMCAPQRSHRLRPDQSELILQTETSTPLQAKAVFAPLNRPVDSGRRHPLRLTAFSWRFFLGGFGPAGSRDHRKRLRRRTPSSPNIANNTAPARPPASAVAQ
jgi:hypothetical protein